MPTCRYFLQGNCRFGNACRFEHTVDNRGNYSNNQYQTGGHSYSYNSSNKYNNPAQSTVSAALQLSDVLKLSHQELIQTVTSDMQCWEQTRMWPMSCCSYWKDGSCIPGFDDVSPEELRCEAYESQISGIIQDYKDRVSSRLNEYQALRQTFVKLSMSDKQKFVSFLEDEKRRVQNNLSTYSSPAFTSSTPALFGSSIAKSQPAQPATLFGKPVPQSFGQSEPSLFSNSQSGVSSQFSAETNLGSPFGTAPLHQPQNNSSTLFGSSTAANNNNNNAVFGSTAVGGVNVFSSTTSNAFISPPADATTAIFPTHPPPVTRIELAIDLKTQGGGGSSVGIGGKSHSAGTILKARSAVYSSLNELSQSDLDQFKAPKFILGMIPTRPPPKELC